MLFFVSETKPYDKGKNVVTKIAYLQSFTVAIVVVVGDMECLYVMYYIGPIHSLVVIKQNFFY